MVDNASTDGSPEYIVERFPQLTYIYNKRNVGFACANNQAMEKARGEYVLLLNPDTLLPETNIAEVLEFMDTHPDAGACGVKMLAPDGHFLPESKRGYPSPATSFWKLTGMHRIFPDNPRFDGYYLSRLDENAVHSVPVLAGAYMMLRRKALNSSGLLDEDFFMYGEDIDLILSHNRSWVQKLLSAVSYFTLQGREYIERVLSVCTRILRSDGYILLQTWYTLSIIIPLDGTGRY